MGKKVLVLGIDGLDPHQVKKYIAEGRMPNTKKFIEMGAANEDYEMICGQPTVTPPMWTTLATGATVRTHGITGYFRQNIERDTFEYNFDSTNCHAEQMWNVTAEAGLKTLVWHWPGSSWPPSSDSENLYVVDGTQPEGINIGTSLVEDDLLIAGSTKVQEMSFRAKTASDTSVPCFLSGLEAEQNESEDDASNMMKRVLMKKFSRVTMDPEENAMKATDNPMDMLSTPIRPAEGWESAPEGALEARIALAKGRVIRYCLVLKGDKGAYDHVAIYKSKGAEEPIATFELDKYTPDYVDEGYDSKDNKIMTNRCARLMSVEEDGSAFRLWLSPALNFGDDTVWSPKELHDIVIENVGYPQPVCVTGGSSKLIIEKLQRPSWTNAAKWNAKGIKYMAREQGFDVIFSHFHNVDLQGHMIVQFMKKGSDTITPEEYQELFAKVYEQTDDYIGEFLPLIDEGWDIIIVSDHGQTTPEYNAETYRFNGSALNAMDMREMGYTVMVKDENGNDTKQVDWSKTTAVMSLYNSVWINLKGRDPHGIVDPADKWDLEEKIITDLYGLKSPETGHRLIAVALHNKDAVLLGEGGEYTGDIVFHVAEGYTADHYDGFSTCDGACDTSVRSVFLAAGPDIKSGFLTPRVVKHMDVAPTVATILGTRMPEQCEGAPVYQIFK